jgi:hypothetical protein
MYPDRTQRRFGRDVYWSMDYPSIDRHLLQGVRRLTRIDARSVEQVLSSTAAMTSTTGP